MKKIFLTIAIGFLFLSLIPGRTYADQVSDLQQKIADTEKQRAALLVEQQKLQAQITEASKQGSSLKSTLNVLEASKKKIDNDLKVTQTNINDANLNIQKLSLTIDEKQKEVDGHKAAIGESMRTLSEYDTHSLVEDLLHYGTLNDVWQDSDNLKSVQNSLASNITALQDAQVELNKQKDQKVATKATLSSLKNQLSGQQATVVETKNAQAKLLAQTQNQEAVYRKLLADNLVREKQFEDQLFEFQSQLLAPTTSAPKANHGLLSWPLATIKVTQQFGRTADAVRLYASGTHSGTDFGTSVGSAVMSAGNGVVVGMGNTDDARTCYSYGRWLFITYDNGLSSIYGHLTSIIVKNGDKVTSGQVVGYSGGVPGAYGSGYSTGPHLHMGLFNTAGVSIQQYTSSIGCKQISIPLANPTDYLDPLAYLPSL